MIRFVLRLIPKRLILLLVLLAVIALVIRYVAQRLAADSRAREAKTRPSRPAQPARRTPPPEQQRDAPPPDPRYTVPRASDYSPRVPWTTRQVLISVAAIAVAFAVIIGSVVGIITIIDLSRWGQHVVLLGATLLLQGIMLLSVWHFAIRGGRWALLGFHRVKPISTTIIAILGITLAQALVVGYTQFVNWLGIESLTPGNPFESWNIDPVSFAIIAFSAIIIAPLFEEIFFRGFMYQAFRKTMSVWPAALLTSAAFGIAHIDPTVIIPIALVGMILLGIYRWTGNLWSSIITHAGYNAVAVTALAVQTWGA